MAHRRYDAQPHWRWRNRDTGHGAAGRLAQTAANPMPSPFVVDAPQSLTRAKGELSPYHVTGREIALVYDRIAASQPRIARLRDAIKRVDPAREQRLSQGR
jgi:hypothetical protein